LIARRFLKVEIRVELYYFRRVWNSDLERLLGDDITITHQFGGCCEEFVDGFMMAGWVGLISIPLRPGVIVWLRVIVEALLGLDDAHVHSC
jgi:hypothetical protein